MDNCYYFKDGLKLPCVVEVNKVEGPYDIVAKL